MKNSVQPMFSILLALVLGALSGVSHAQITLSFSGFEPVGESSSGSVSISGAVGQPEGASQSQEGFDRLLHGAVVPGEVASDDPVALDFAVQDMGDNSAPRLTWSTSTEEDILGFDLYRAVDTGSGDVPGERLTSSPVVPTGTVTTGANYEFFDPSVFSHGGGDRAYLLAVIDSLGGATFFGVIILSDPGVTSVPDWQTLNH